MADDNQERYKSKWGEYDSQDQAVDSLYNYAAQLQDEVTRLKAAPTQQQAPPQQNPQAPQATQFVSGAEADDYSHDKFLKSFVQDDPVDAFNTAIKKKYFKNSKAEGDPIQFLLAAAGRLQQLEAAVAAGQIGQQHPEIDIRNPQISQTIQQIQREENLLPGQVSQAIKLGQASGRLPTNAQYQEFVKQNIGQIVQQQFQPESEQGPMFNPYYQPQQQQQYRQQPTPMRIAPPSIGNRGTGAPRVDEAVVLQKMNEAKNATEAQTIFDNYVKQTRTA